MSKSDTRLLDREVGRRIKMRRLELGISQTVLAKEINLTFQQVQKYEKGANRVGAGQLQHIAKFLKVPVSFFFEEFGAVGQGSEISAMLDTAHAIRLLRAFVKLEDRDLRLRIIELLEAVSQQPGGDAMAKNAKKEKPKRQ